MASFENRLDDTLPDYTALVERTEGFETLVVLSSEKNERKTIHQICHRETMKKYGFGCLAGFMVALVLFLVAAAIWNSVENSPNGSDNILSCQKRIVGHYQGFGGVKIRESQLEQLSHLIFDETKINEDGRVYFADDESRLLFVDMKQKCRTMKSGLKVMISTEFDDTDHFRKALEDSEIRNDRVEAVTSFLVEHELDGVQVSYVWPETKEDKENYVLFVRELKYKLEKIAKISKRKEPFILAIYASQTGWVGDETSFLDDIMDYADFLNVQTYHYHGYLREDGLAGPSSPLYSHGQDDKSVDWTMNAYTCSTKSPSRLNFVVPFVGASWNNVTMSNVGEPYGVNVNAVHPGEDVSWRNLKTKGWNLASAAWDDGSKTPFIYDPVSQRLLTFENERSIQEKVKYMIDKNIGGISIDRLEHDDESDTLLKAITSFDLCSGPMFKKDEIKYSCGNKRST